MKSFKCSMAKKIESLAKKNEDNSEEYITEWQADIIKGLEKVKDKYGLVIEYDGPFSDKWKEYPTYSVFVRKGGKKEDIGTVGTDYVQAFVEYTSPSMNVSRPHKAKDYSTEEAIQVILDSAKMCMGKKGESNKSEAIYDRPVTLYATTRYDDAEEAQKFLDGIGGGEVKVSKGRNGDTLSVSIEGADEDIDAFLAVYKDNYATLEKDCDADVTGWTDPVDLKYYTVQGRKELMGESKKSEGIDDRIKMNIDYNTFMELCDKAAYLDGDKDYHNALWDYFSAVGEISEDATVFFDNLFQYTAWKDVDELYDEFLSDKYKDSSKSRKECVQDAIDDGNIDATEYGDGKYLVIY